MGRRQSQTEKQARKAERAKVTLKDKMVSSGMLERYEKSVTQFLDFAKDFNYKIHQWEELDELASRWVEHIFHDGCHKPLASDGLAGLQFYLPAALGRLKHSWKLAKVWQKLEPPRRVLPLSPTMVKAMAGAAISLGFLSEASGMLVAFDTMLRSESQRCQLLRCSCRAVPRIHQNRKKNQHGRNGGRGKSFGSAKFEEGLCWQAAQRLPPWAGATRLQKPLQLPRRSF